MRNIERRGKVDGRWPRYSLVVDGVWVGDVRRTTSVGRDGLAGRQQPRYDAWAIPGMACESRAQAETTLIERAIRFGKLR